MRLYVNIDHVATLREARKTDEPDPVRAAEAAALGVAAIELHTGRYAHTWRRSEAALAALRRAAREARALGLALHAGHGLTYENVQPVAAIAEIEELNIGHSIVSNAVFWGMEEAVRRMRKLVDEAPPLTAES